MFRLTLGKVKTQIANALNFNTTDPRLTTLINEANERLLHSGRWMQTTFRFQVCVNNACITWPRQIESIDAWALDGSPGVIRNKWFEFLGSGPGTVDENNNLGVTLIDRGIAVSFDDPTGSDKKLAISCDQTETTTDKFLIQYYNSSSQWVRTQDDSLTWIDGEELSLPAAGAYTYSTYEVLAGGLAGVIKPITNNIVRLWEYDTVAGTYRALGVYEPSEEIPQYRRSLIPGLSCTSSDSSCDYCTVTVIGKLRHIDASNDNDYLIIGSLPALKLACKAIRKEEEDKIDEAMKYWLLSEKLLDNQLQHYNGGNVVPLKVEGSFIGNNLYSEIM